jgi:hypothetical protein
MCYSFTFLVLVTVSQPFVLVLASEALEFEFDLEVSQPSQFFKLKVSSTAPFKFQFHHPNRSNTSKV